MTLAANLASGFVPDLTDGINAILEGEDVGTYCWWHSEKGIYLSGSLDKADLWLDQRHGFPLLPVAGGVRPDYGAVIGQFGGLNVVSMSQDNGLSLARAMRWKPGRYVFDAADNVYMAAYLSSATTPSVGARVLWLSNNSSVMANMTSSTIFRMASIATKTGGARTATTPSDAYAVDTPLFAEYSQQSPTDLSVFINRTSAASVVIPDEPYLGGMNNLWTNSLSGATTNQVIRYAFILLCQNLPSDVLRDAINSYVLAEFT